MTTTYLTPTARQAPAPGRATHVRAVPSTITPSTATPSRTPGGPVSVLVELSAPSNRRAVDLPGLAQAVERLVQSLAPDVVTSITVGERVRALPASDGDGARDRRGGDPDVEVYLDLARRTLTIDGDRKTLTRREFDLLSYLTHRRGIAVTRRELMARVWGAGYSAGDRTIDVHVRRLRVKLGRHGSRITTLRGYGYRFD